MKRTYQEELKISEEEIVEAIIKDRSEIYEDMNDMENLTSNAAFGYITTSNIQEVLLNYAGNIMNMDTQMPVIEKGKDGTCLFYSLMHAELQPFLLKNFAIKYPEYGEIKGTVPSHHKRNGQKMRTKIGETLFKVYTRYDGLKEEVLKPSYKKGGFINPDTLSPEFVSLYPLLGSSSSKETRIHGFNGEGEEYDKKMSLSRLTNNALKDYLKPSFFAGEKTIAAYSLLYKKHIIVLNLSYKTNCGPVQDAQVIVNRYTTRIKLIALTRNITS